MIDKPKAKIKHDPETCGIDIAGDCDDCLRWRLQMARAGGNTSTEAASRWEQLCRQTPDLRDNQAPLHRETLLPDVPPAFRRQLVAALLSPALRPVLTTVLTELLAVPMAGVMTAATERPAPHRRARATA